MKLLNKLGLFALGSVGAYGIFAGVFGLYCIVGGHNMLEMMYGGFASILLALPVGVGLAIWAPELQRRWSEPT
ncbi:hypothetical protein ACVOMV_27010 (plasmid) [Mesorhizobium atlanticum]|uniref:hypothetical protein n=1 Tax=Mesorhizobium atlanticum TaxID=2233532 RepID=UPI0037046405